MSAPVSADQRFTLHHSCPVCGGHKDLASGQGQRCYGFLSADTRYAHCTREERAHGLARENGGTYPHRLDGSCPCGQIHGDVPPATNGHQTEPMPRRVIKTRRWRHAMVDGKPIEHVRLDFNDGSKQVWWEHGGETSLHGTRVEDLPLYGGDAIGDAKGVIVVEGEPARDALEPLARELGLAVVGTVTGASTHPSDDVLRALPTVPVYLWPDSDAPGETHASAIASAFFAMGRRADEVRRLIWPNARPGAGDDDADFVKAGGTVAELAARYPGMARWRRLAPRPPDPDHQGREP